MKVKTGANTSDAVYNGWYSGVYQTESAQVSAVLTGITIGSLQLTPSFDAGTTSYTAETVNDEDAVSATAASGTAVMILVNGAAHTSGNDATWGERNQYRDGDREQDRMHQYGLYRNGDKERTGLIHLRAGLWLCPFL